MRGSAASPEAFLLRRRLRRELSQARVASGLTQADAADALGVSLSTVIRAELGETAIPAKDVLAYTHLYGMTERVDELAAMAQRAARLPWREYRDIIPKETLEFFGYEASASSLRIYQNEVVPGLLQTRDYTANLMSTAFSCPQEEIERNLALRNERQTHAWEGHTRHHFVLDEAVLRRFVGPVQVMCGQLRHLADLVAQGIEIQVLRFTAGASFAVHGSFTLIEFEEDDEDVLYLEHSAGSRVVKDSPHLTRFYRSGFAELVRLATSTSGTKVIIDDVLEAMDGG